MSDTPNASHKFQGYVDIINPQRAKGWVWLEGRPEERVYVIARLGNTILAERIADAMRADLVAAGVGDGYHAFELEFHRTLSREELGSVEIAVRESRDVLTVAPNAIQAASFIGCVDLLTRRHLSGWVWNEMQTNERVQIVVRIGNETIAELIASEWRRDLVAAGIGDGHHAFNLVFPRILSKAKLALLDVKVKQEAYVVPLSRGIAAVSSDIAGWHGWNDMYVPFTDGS